MDRIVRLIVITLCVLAGSTALFAQSATASQDARIENLEKQLAQMRAELAALKAASTGATQAQLAEIERKIDILASEIETMKTGPAHTPSEPLTPDQTDARYGLGLSASKVYGITRGVSLGGYGEAFTKLLVHRPERTALASDRIDMLRVVGYLSYKFDDHWV
jgi:hypothetical protein